MSTKSAIIRKVIICDDHPIVRGALQNVIESEDDLEVAALAEDGRQLATLVTALVPDLVIVDIEMPRWDGIVSIQRLIELLPELRILVFSAHEEQGLIRLAADSGAAGFVGKSESAAAILPAVRTIVKGGRWFPEWLTESEDGVAVTGRPDTDELQRLRSLTPREREILDMYADGMKTKVVAEKIGIRTATVYTHVRNAIRKLSVDSRTQAVVLATRFRFLPAESEQPQRD
ncbi:MAG: response regulator transcription factor [Solirubrobacterales bacterium]